MGGGSTWLRVLFCGFCSHLPSGTNVQGLQGTLSAPRGSLPCHVSEAGRARDTSRQARAPVGVRTVAKATLHRGLKRA